MEMLNIQQPKGYYLPKKTLIRERVLCGRFGQTKELMDSSDARRLFDASNNVCANCFGCHRNIQREED